MNAVSIAKPLKNSTANPVRMGPVIKGKTKADNNRYCGPAVISSLTGCTTGEAAYLIRTVNRLKMVAGTHSVELFRVLKTFGISALTQQEWSGKDCPTLAMWLKETHGSRGGRTFLISAGHHWQLVSGNKFVCGLTKEIVDLKHPKVKRRARVRKVWEITMAFGQTTPIKPAKHPLLLNRAKEQVAKRAVAKTGARAQFVKQAKACGWKWEVSYDDYLEIEPCAEFPIGLTTLHYNWDESWDRVRHCLAHPEDISEEGYYSE